MHGSNTLRRGMMILKGIGDPSNGHGGYSFLKLPLKMSQDSLGKAKLSRYNLNPAIRNPKAVTGTDADLRKLSKVGISPGTTHPRLPAVQEQIRDMLLELGYTKDQIEELSRWDRVALLRDQSSQAVSMGIKGEFRKYARGVRVTSKM